MSLRTEDLLAVQKKALDAIGPSEAGDADLDIDVHLARLPLSEEARANSGALRQLLTKSVEAGALREIVAQYRIYDAKARRAKQVYQLLTLTLIVLLVAVLLLVVFLTISPQRLPANVETMLAYLVGVAIVFFVVVVFGLAWTSIATFFDARRPRPEKPNENFQVPERARPAPGSWACYADWVRVWFNGRRHYVFIVGALAILGPGVMVGAWLQGFPDVASLWEERNSLYSILFGLVFVLLVAIYVATGVGMVARTTLSPKASWYAFRADAEMLRRHYFQMVVRVGRQLHTNRDLMAKAGAGAPPLVSQVTEYVRRFHIEAQQAHYLQHGLGSNLRWRLHASASLAVLVGFVLSASAYVASHLTMCSEQGAAIFGCWPMSSALAGVTGFLLDRWADGWGLVVVIGSLVFFGGALLALAVVALTDAARVANRYYRAYRGLAHVTSTHPGKISLDRSPLSACRTAAASGQTGYLAWEPLARLCRDVNLVLEKEIGNWETDMRYEIDYVQQPAPRVTGRAPLTSADYDAICRQLRAHGESVFRTRKVSRIAVEVAQREENFTTNYYGEETRNTAHPGDWIVTNMDRIYDPDDPDPDKYLLQDSAGNFDTYIIARADKKANYQPTGKHTSRGEVYEPVADEGEADAIWLAAGFDIVAPWGQRQTREWGYLIRKNAPGEPDDIYGVYGPVFEATYERIGAISTP